MKQNFFDNIDNGWDDLVSDVYNKDIVTIKPDSSGVLIINRQNYEKLKNAKHLVIAEGTRIIERDDWYKEETDLNNIKTIKFPSTLRVINKLSFIGLANLQSIEFNGEMNVIGAHAFSKCKNLKTIKFNGSVEHIENAAFEKCDITGELVLPKGLKIIGFFSFIDNKNITSIKFPDGLKTIKHKAFGECYGLSDDLVIPKSVTTISSHAFNNCNNIKRIFVNKENGSKWINDGFWNINCSAEIIYY